VVDGVRLGFRRDPPRPRDYAKTERGETIH